MGIPYCVCTAPWHLPTLILLPLQTSTLEAKTAKLDREVLWLVKKPKPKPKPKPRPAFDLKNATKIILNGAWVVVKGAWVVQKAA